MKKHRIHRKISEVVSQIVERFHPEKIILFGSATRGRFNANSDIDVLIIKSNVPSRGIDRQLLIDKLIDRCGIALDLLVYKPEEINESLRLGDPFIKNILKNGVALYG